MLEEITQLMHRGDIHRAEKAARQWLREQPALADAHHMMGLVKARQGALAEAVRLLEQATNLAPDQGQHYAALAGVELRAGRNKAAEANFRSALKLNPTLINAYNGLGQMALAQGRVDEAERQFLIALRVDDGYPQVLAGLANVAMMRNEPQTAIKLLNRALERAPNEPTLLASLGTAFRAAGMLEYASQALQRAIEGSPRVPALRRQLLGVLAELGQFAEAEQQLEHLARGGEAPATLSLIRGDLALRQNQYARAAEAFRDALKTQPGQSMAIMGLARCLGAEQGDEAALDCLREYLSSHPQLAPLWRALVDHLAALNRTDEAVAAAREWRAALPDDADAMAQLAMLLELSGCQDEAESIARERIATDDKDIAAQLVVVRAGLARGEAAAVRDVLSTLDISNASAAERRAVLQTLGRCHDQLDESAQALTCWLHARGLESSLQAPPVPTALDGAQPLEGELQPVALRLLSALPGAGLEILLSLLSQHASMQVLVDRFNPDHRQDWLNERPGAVDPQGAVDLADHMALKRRRYLRALQRIPSKPDTAQIDCLPWLDAGHAASVRLALPDARLLLLLRDPRDSILAWLAQGSMQRYLPGTLEQAVAWLADAVRHQQHWQQRAGTQMHVCRYEDLIAAPEQRCAELASFFGCAASTAALTLSRPPMDTPPGHWRRYREALAPVMDELSALAALLGYPAD